MSGLGERFWSKVERGAGCWRWISYLDEDGYGRYCLSACDRNARAHRLAYEELVGPIPPGLTLDHLCRTPACVNPSHLEPVTAAENTRRANAVRAPEPHCRRGHAFDAANTAQHHGRRECRTCNAARQRARRRRAA